MRSTIATSSRAVTGGGALTGRIPRGACPLTFLSCFAFAVACGQDQEAKSPSDGQTACQELAAKRSQCGFTSGAQCSTLSPCVTRCGATASCDALAADQPAGDYLACLVECGLRPSAFECKTGEIISSTDRCDGVIQCADESDESDCGGGDAGPSDGGTTPETTDATDAASLALGDR